MGATGLESSAASAYFVSRSGRRRKKFVKVSVLVLCGSLIPASMVVDRLLRYQRRELRPARFSHLRRSVRCSTRVRKG